ncbi:WD40-repeat-containing domain protein [Astrocystis sublimbata]|nr:WD40-repeat-containing domain protein [Astrocystis sublimbata]
MKHSAREVMSHEAAHPGSLRRKYVLSPITALAFLTLSEQQYLLAAEDTDIKIYDVVTSQLCGILPVFKAQPIHGISVPPTVAERNAGASRGSSSRILVWGGSAVKVLSTRIVEELICATSTNDSIGPEGDLGSVATAALFVAQGIAPDWIFDGRISPFDDSCVVLLTAHNEVVQGRVSADGKTVCLGQVQSPSRPILYSGNFFWVDKNCVLVAAGTVFGEIVVWKCYLDSNADTGDWESGNGVKLAHEGIKEAGCEVLYVFSGHEGSVFGVHISPEIVTSSGETIRLLASCSDDRTIRIWDITEKGDDSETNGNAYEARMSDARETGFGDSIVGSVGLYASQSRCVATAIGHVSRIWQVAITAPNQLSGANTIEVFSFGEDATMQKWHLGMNPSIKPTSKVCDTGADSSDPPPFQLTHQETFANHSGKQIWSHAIADYGSGLILVTGGGDGKIVLMKNESSISSKILDRAPDRVKHHTRSIQENDISPASLIEICQPQNIEVTPTLTSFKHGNGTEAFQNFTFITDDKLLVTTRSGRMFLGHFDSTSNVQWKELALPDTVRTAIQSYTILKRSRRTATAFIGAPNGQLFFYDADRGDSLHPFHKAERKITEIICLSDIQPPSPKSGADAAGESGRDIELLITIFGIPKAELLRLNQNHTLIERTEVTIPEKFIVTSAAWCHNYLIIGSRHGGALVFDLATDGGQSPILSMKVKSGDAVTSILPLPRQSGHSPLYFLTTARDGKYRVYEILNATSDFQLRLLHETRPSFGPLIEGSWLFTKPDGSHDLMLCGFRSKYFVVWNATEQREVATIDCGGGHRVFDHVQVGGNREGIRFACTKASQMKVYSQTHAPHFPLKTGGHGREIKAISASGKFVATAAEDTVIRLWKFRDGSQGGKAKAEEPDLLRCVLALEKHNTGIQKLKWADEQYLFSSGGNEEFFVWRIVALESDICPLGVVCEAVFPDRSEIGDLRITDFDVQCFRNGSSSGERLDNNGAHVKELSTGSRFCISMTLSNSSVQSYLYSAQQGFRLLGRRTYTGACLTQVQNLHFTDEDHPQVLTAATDGHLAVFPDLQTPGNDSNDTNDVLVTKLHQSTVKALDMRSVATDAGTSYLVVTGGDDDAIGVVHLYRSAEQPSARYEMRNKSIVRSTHAAAITGLGIVRLENSGRDAVVVTASNDQRIKTWRLVEWQSTSLRVHLLDDQYSGVADAGDLEVLGDEGVDEDKKCNGLGGRVLVAGVGVEVWDIA